MNERSIEIREKAFTRLVESWREMVRPLSDTSTLSAKNDAMVIEAIRDAANGGISEAQLFMAEHCLRMGQYREAAQFAIMIDAKGRAAAILRECFEKCQPGELDYLKWAELDADAKREPDSKKCLAADMDDRGCIVRGDCGIKCNGEWQVGEHGREHGDFWCQYDGRWTQCPMYCGAVYRGYEPRTTYCGSLV